MESCHEIKKLKIFKKAKKKIQSKCKRYKASTQNNIYTAKF